MSQKTYYDFYQTLDEPYYEIGDYMNRYNKFFSCKLNIKEIINSIGTLDYFELVYEPNIQMTFFVKY